VEGAPKGCLAGFEGFGVFVPSEAWNPQTSTSQHIVRNRGRSLKMNTTTSEKGRCCIQNTPCQAAKRNRVMLQVLSALQTVADPVFKRHFESLYPHLTTLIGSDQVNDHST
jgi:hypothetical protein